jgi:hypothetical protein
MPGSVTVVAAPVGWNSIEGVRVEVEDLADLPSQERDHVMRVRGPRFAVRGSPEGTSLQAGHLGMTGSTLRSGAAAIDQPEQPGHVRRRERQSRSAPCWRSFPSS